ncbi:MAG TPA: hypothetical protein VMU97_02005 [Candidatus Dormibacteraeota bacterium]|nr:hypothetical protein [Candidatus Dormibacteraeota bacterium]
MSGSRKSAEVGSLADADKRQLQPMAPDDLLANAQKLKDRPVEARSIYGSVDVGICQGAGSLALADGQAKGALVLKKIEAENETGTVHIPGMIIAALAEVRPDLKPVPDQPLS